MNKIDKGPAFMKLNSTYMDSLKYWIYISIHINDIECKYNQDTKILGCSSIMRQACFPMNILVITLEIHLSHKIHIAKHLNIFDMQIDILCKDRSFKNWKEYIFSIDYFKGNLLFAYWSESVSTFRLSVKLKSML